MSEFTADSVAGGSVAPSTQFPSASGAPDATAAALASMAISPAAAASSAAAAVPPTGAQTVDPWTVESDGAIDYDRLIAQFGTQRLDPALVQRFEAITGHKAHRFLRRGIFFSHRDLGAMLDLYQKVRRPP